MQPPPCAPLCWRVAPANLVLFVPSRAGVSNSPALGDTGLSRCPPLGARFMVVRPFFHYSASEFSIPPSSYGVTPAPSGIPCFSRLRRVALVGLLRRSLRRAIRHAPIGALPSVGTAVSLRGFLSAIAVFCDHGGRGFPLGAVAQGFPPCPHARTPATCTHYLSAPWGQCSSLAVLGACAPAPIAVGVFAAPLHPLRPRRGERYFS